MQAAIFLDRDGVIIKNRSSYVRSWADVEIFPQALSALARINKSPFKIVVITNQSGVGRGLIPLKVAEEINKRLATAVEIAGGRIDGTFMCTHAPEDACICRKPRPGLLLQAARELSIDLGQSIMIGDALSDLKAGKAAGVGLSAIVLTGRGAQQVQLPESVNLQPFLIFNTLAEALENLIR